MKKALLIGAGIGAFIVVFATLGLVSQTAELLGRPLISLPAFVINSLIDTSTTNGAISMGLLVIVSAIFYGAIAALVYKVGTKYGKAAGAAVLIATLALLAFGQTWIDDPQQQEYDLSDDTNSRPFPILKSNPLDNY